MSFKGASQKEQARLTRAVPRKFGNFADEYLTDEEYLKLLRTKVAEMERRLATLKPGSFERKQLGRKKQELSQEIFMLSGKRKKPGKTLSNCFVDVVRKAVSREVFDHFMQLAVDEQNKTVKCKEGL